MLSVELFEHTLFPKLMGTAEDQRDCSQSLRECYIHSVNTCSFDGKQTHFSSYTQVTFKNFLLSEKDSGPIMGSCI